MVGSLLLFGYHHLFPYKELIYTLKPLVLVQLFFFSSNTFKCIVETKNNDNYCFSLSDLKLANG